MNAKTEAGLRHHVAGRVKFLVGVADDAHSRTAVLFAAHRAKNTDGRITLLHVLAPPEYQHWVAVGDLMREETREEAEQLLQRLAHEVHERFGLMPEFVVREGGIGDEILKQVEEDPGIDMLVVGAAAASEGKRKLISWLAGQLAGKLNIPLLIVPGNLTDEQIASLT